jgi:hypothetical protein
MRESPVWAIVAQANTPQVFPNVALRQYANTMHRARVTGDVESPQPVRRMQIRFGRSLMLALSLALASACAAYVRPDGSVYIKAAPPALRVEVRGSAPSRESVWVGGHWQWSGAEYVWVGGRWATPDSGRHQWVEGQWRHDSGGYFWVEGHWR